MVKKIVIIDDDEMILQLVKISLESEGYEVETFASALGATTKIIALKPDLIILDVNIPGLSGTGLSEVLNKFTGKTPMPIVFYSSIEENRLQNLAAVYNALGYITKASTMLQLMNQVKRFLLVANTNKHSDVSLPFT